MFFAHLRQTSSAFYSVNCFGKTGRWNKQCGPRSLDSWRQMRYTPNLSEGFTWFFCLLLWDACQRKADTAPGRRAIFRRANGGVTEYISESEPRKCHFYFWFGPLFILCFGVTVRNKLFCRVFPKKLCQTARKYFFRCFWWILPPAPSPDLLGEAMWCLFTKCGMCRAHASARSWNTRCSAHLLSLKNT